MDGYGHLVVSKAKKLDYACFMTVFAWSRQLGFKLPIVNMRADLEQNECTHPIDLKLRA